jgi:predicted MFS family arabinose efflux permease
MATVIRDLLLSGMLLVTGAGLYACCYALGRLTGRRWLVRCSYLFAALQMLGVLGMILPGHLDPGWKYLVAFTGLALLAIPQAMWWVVVTMHAHHHADQAP